MTIDVRPGELWECVAQGTSAYGMVLRTVKVVMPPREWLCRVEKCPAVPSRVGKVNCYDVQLIHSSGAWVCQGMAQDDVQAVVPSGVDAWVRGLSTRSNPDVVRPWSEQELETRKRLDDGLRRVFG
jgi:hypothetical protein